MLRVRSAQRLLLFLVTGCLLISATAIFANAAESNNPLTNRTWWLPKDVSTTGHQVDTLFDVILWMTMVVGFAVFVVLGIFMVKFRYRPDRKATFIHGNAKLEIVWTLIPALIMAGVAAISQATWKEMKHPDHWPKAHNDPARGENEKSMWDLTHATIDAAQVTTLAEALTGKQKLNEDDTKVLNQAVAAGDVKTVAVLLDSDVAKLKDAVTYNSKAVHIHVISQQFNWLFHYPGPDGKHGGRKIQLINKSGTPSEGVGLDMSDPNAADDFVTTQMVVPVNTKVFLHVTSLDVIHSFFLPNFRVKQDTVPGLISRVWLESTELSEKIIGIENPDDGGLVVTNTESGEDTEITHSKPFDIVCAELCGANHYAMRGQLYVVKENEYEQFLFLNIDNTLRDSIKSAKRKRKDPNAKEADDDDGY